MWQLLESKDKMEISKTNSQYSVKENNKKNRNVGTSIGSSLLGGCVPIAFMPLTNSVVNKIQKIGQLSQDKVDILHNAAETALCNTGLKEKGAKIVYLKREAGEIPPPKILRNLSPLEQVKDGKNAFYAFKDAINPLTKEVMFSKNTIMMPEKDLSYIAFHEIGHGLNHNFSKLGRFLQKMRNPMMAIAGNIALFFAFTKNAKQEEGKDLTTGQKFKNFVRNNAGKLSFAAMLPILLEEGMATYKGQKLADKLLTNDMAKIVSKGTKVAYLTYIIGALSIATTSFATVKIKDYLVAKKENKSDNKVV